MLPWRGTGRPTLTPQRIDARTIARGLQVAGLLAVLVFGTQHLLSLVETLGSPGGPAGLGFAGTTGSASWVRVLEAPPDAPMAKAGVRPGDEIRFTNLPQLFRAMRPGERVPITVRRGAAPEFRVDVVAAPIARRLPQAQRAIEDQARSSLAALLPLLLAAIVLGVSRGRLGPALLGVVILGAAGPPARLSMHVPDGATVWLADLNTSIELAANVAIVALAVSFNPDGRPRLTRWGGWTLVAFGAAAGSLVAVASAAPFVPGLLRLVPGFAVTILVLECVLFVVALLARMARAPAPARRRYALMLAGAALIPLSEAVDQSIATTTSPDLLPVHLAAMLVGSGLAPGLMAYAILVDRVFDLGFALNRTLVYGAVSALLLATFGLVEWAVDHFIPIEGREKNVFVDAGLALLVYLTFHRVRDLVESLVERIFFRRWREAEARLRLFVRDAAFAVQAARLGADFEAEAGAFLGRPGAARLARLERSGRFEAPSGTGPALSLDPDTPEVRRLRASLGPVRGGPGPFAGAWFLPTIAGHEVTGFLLVAARDDRLELRPDEAELLAWATVEVGRVLEALKLRSLAQEAQALREEALQARRELEAVRGLAILKA